MSSVVAYSQVVDAVCKREVWDEVYFSLLSLKAHMQSLPGWQRFDLWARDLESGDIKVVVVTNWDYPEQLELWLKKGVTVDSILRSLEPKVTSVNVDVYEEIA